MTTLRAVTVSISWFTSSPKSPNERIKLKRGNYAAKRILSSAVLILEDIEFFGNRNNRSANIVKCYRLQSSINNLAGEFKGPHC